MRQTIRIAPLTLSVRCPYKGCGELFSVECADLRDYVETVECWHCGGISVARLTIRATATVSKVDGEQDRVNRRLDALEAELRANAAAEQDGAGT